MKFRIYCKDSSAEWFEDYDKPEVTDILKARKYSRELIESFNNSLHSGERFREILNVVFGEGDGKREHDWEKTNLVTIMKRDTSYDTARCRVCGCTARRYGIGGYTLDKKFQKEKWKSCPGEK